MVTPTLLFKHLPLGFIPVPAAVSVSLGVTLFLMAFSSAAVWVWLRWGRDWVIRSKNSEARLKLQMEKSVQLRKRGRVLEKILAVSVSMNTTRNLQELHTRIVDSVQEIGNFEQVVLHLWSESTLAFEARASAGVAELGKAGLIGQQVSRPEYLELSSARHRYSNCYLVSPPQVDDGGFILDPTENQGQAGPSRERHSWLPGQVLVAPLINSGGEELGYLSLENPVEGFVPDMVDIRQLEFLFQQIATAIETAVLNENLARNNADLQVASEKLNSLSDMKNNFVANVSHELRTPLTSISAYTELLQQNTGSMTEEVRSEFLKVIHGESLKLTGIINDILDLASMEDSQPVENQVEVDLVALAQRLEESWKSRAQEMNIKLELETTCQSLMISVDSLLIQQLLGHLLNNAFKFSDHGGKVVVKIQETGTAVKLVVQDAGIGIPEDQLGEIFDRFFQVDGSATREHNGQGVGLAICKDIVNHHDGRIWAENMKPSGARFTVLLPRRPLVVQSVDQGQVSSSPFQPGEFMQRVMHWVGESLGVKTATLMMTDKDEEYLTIRAAIGLPETVVQSARVRKGSGIVGRVWESGQPLLVEDITGEEGYGRDLNEPRYSTASLLSVPLMDRQKCLGVLSVNNRIDGKNLDDDDRLLLESMTPILSNMIARYGIWQNDSRHFAQVRDTLRSITSVGQQRQESLLETCQEICLATARNIMMPEDDLEHLAFALQFYDVGLGMVPAKLLNKPGPLTRQEYEVVQKHVRECLKILEPLVPDSKARQIILHHHENVDGTGYPVGLAGEAIPLGSRLLRLTDVLAALLSPRPWRPAFSLDVAMEEVSQGVGIEFCPRMTEIFLKETESRRERILDQQARRVDQWVFKRPAPDPAQISQIPV